jgi:hypothetical protein
MEDLTYTVELTQPKGSDFGAQLNEVLRFLSLLKANPTVKNVNIDLARIKFVYPLFILVIASLSEYLKKSGLNLSIRSTSNINCAEYLDKIFSLPISWPGTFVAMRIKKGIKNFSIYTYV